MKYIVIPDSGKVRQLPFFFAVEEYVARTFNDDEYFCIWQVPPTVMLGRNQLVNNETNLDYCRQHGISVFRRKSGGGCVYADGGCLQFSYIVSDNNVGNVFQTYMRVTAGILQKAGIEAQLSGRNDILVEGHKVAGAAFYRTANRSVMHNTLLYSTDLDMLNKAVTPPAEKLQSKGVRSVSQRVGNVGDFTDMTIEDFVAFARKVQCGDAFRELTQDDLREIEEIEKSLASDEFVYGNNPRYTVVRKQHIADVGYVEAYVEIKNDIIRNVNLMGDYFLLGDVDRDFLCHLYGVEFKREAVGEAIAGVELSSIIRGLDNRRFLRLLFGREPHVKKPEWLRVRLMTDQHFAETEHIIRSQCLHTICQSGLCPNRAECWRNGTATFMIGGDVCTRSCKFCNTKTGVPLPLDPTEPQRVAESVRQMKLRYAVITSVDRDDLPDMGAGHWATTIRRIRETNPQTGIEVLIPDFQGREDLIDTVLDASPDVVGHNMETVRRLTPSVRSAAKYEQSLRVLRHVASKGFACKTGIMLGLGETEEEILETMSDIRATGCTILTIGQYLQPSSKHLPVVEYVTPEKFQEYKEAALSKGFKHAESGPLVRSSYHAEKLME